MRIIFNRLRINYKLIVNNYHFINPITNQIKCYTINNPVQQGQKIEEQEDPVSLLKLLTESIKLKELSTSLKLYKDIYELDSTLINQQHYSNIIQLIGESVKARKIEHTKTRYNGNAYVNVRPNLETFYVKQIKWILEHIMENNTIILNQQDWDSIFVALSKDFQFEYLESLFYTILKKQDVKCHYEGNLMDNNLFIFNNIQISTIILNSMLHLYSRYPYNQAYGLNNTKKLFEILNLFDNLNIQKDLRSYINVLSGIDFYLKKSEDFEMLLERLINQVYKLYDNTNFFNKLMLCYFNRKEYDKINSIYDKIIPNIQSLNIKIQVQHEQGILSDDIYKEFLKQLNQHQLIPNLVSLNLLLKIAMLQSNLNLSYKVIEKFKQYSILLNSISYFYLIQSQCNLKNIDSAEAAVKNYMDRKDLKLVAQPFLPILKYYSLYDKQKYLDLIKLFLISKMSLSYGIYNVILYHNLENDLDLKFCIKVFKSSIRSLREINLDLLKLVCRIYFKSGSNEDALILDLDLNKQDVDTFIKNYFKFLKRVDGNGDLF